MVQYNNEIGVLPGEKKGHSRNALEARNGIGLLPVEIISEENQKTEEVLRNTKKPKITDEQFRQHLNADPKLKAAYAEHQALMERQKQATERVKNTGYLGTLWGGITGDSGIDELAKINEETNAANKRFGDALDQNAGYSQELKQQLRGYKLGANSDVHAATAQAAGDASERAENYAGATTAVRNTAIGAGLGVSAVLTGGATLGAASTILAGGGSATMAGGVVAGGALTGALGNTGYSLLRGEADVALDASLNDRNLGQVQNAKNEQILKNSTQATRDGAKFGAALPLAVTPLGKVALAGVGAYGGAKSVQNAGENFGQASTISGQEKVARASGDTAGADRLKEQRNNHISEGVLSVGDTAAILGAGNFIGNKITGSRSGNALPSPKGNSQDLYIGPNTGRQNTKRKTQEVTGIDLPPAGDVFKKSNIGNRPSPTQSRPEINISSLPNGDRRVSMSGQDKKGNLRVYTNVITPASPRSEGGFVRKRFGADDGFPDYHSSSIEKRTPAGEVSNLERTDVMVSRSPSGFGKQSQYSKTGPDGNPVSTREYDPQFGVGSSIVKNTDGSISKRTYKRDRDDSSLTSFDGPHESRVNHRDKGGGEIQYRFPTVGPDEIPKIYQKIKKPDGTIFHGSASLKGGSEDRVKIRPTSNTTKWTDASGNARTKTVLHDYENGGTVKTEITKTTPGGSVSNIIASQSPRGTEYKYEKKGSDGSIQSTRSHYDPEFNFVTSTRNYPDGSKSIRYYHDNIATFHGPHENRQIFRGPDGKPTSMHRTPKVLPQNDLIDYWKYTGPDGNWVKQEHIVTPGLVSNVGSPIPPAPGLPGLKDIPKSPVPYHRNPPNTRPRYQPYSGNTPVHNVLQSNNGLTETTIIDGYKPPRRRGNNTPYGVNYRSHTEKNTNTGANQSEELAVNDMYQMREAYTFTDANGVQHKNIFKSLGERGVPDSKIAIQRSPDGEISYEYTGPKPAKKSNQTSRYIPEVTRTGTIRSKNKTDEKISDTVPQNKPHLSDEEIGVITRDPRNEKVGK